MQPPAGTNSREVRTLADSGLCIGNSRFKTACLRVSICHKNKLCWTGGLQRQTILRRKTALDRIHPRLHEVAPPCIPRCVLRFRGAFQYPSLLANTRWRLGTVPLISAAQSLQSHALSNESSLIRPTRISAKQLLRPLSLPQAILAHQSIFVGSRRD